MKTLGLVLAMMFLLGGCCFAASTVMASFNVNLTGYALIGLPNVPVDSNIGGTQTDGNGDANGVFGAFNNDAMKLLYWNGGGYTIWSKTANWNALLLGQGYWVSSATVDAAGGTVSYPALNDGVPDLDANSNPVTHLGTNGLQNPVCTDMYISLPGKGIGTGGYTMIGLPFNHDVAISSVANPNTGDRIQFTNGTQVLGWQAAVNAGWVGGIWLRWNGGGYSFHGYVSSASGTLLHGYGYWVQTKVDNLAVIIPGMEENQ